MVIVPPEAERRERIKTRGHNRWPLRRRLLARIVNRPAPEHEDPMITASDLQYELGRRAPRRAAGGLRTVLLVARREGLIAAIEHDLRLLNRHLPCHESD